MYTAKIVLTLTIILGSMYALVKAVLREKAVGITKRIGKNNILMIDPIANFFGQKSVGVRQIRGNGTLVLTRDELYFELLLPKKTVKIPLEKIEGIEEGRSHLGKATPSKLLKIAYKDESGTTDSCAWLVKDRKTWVEKIEHLRK